MGWLAVPAEKLLVHAPHVVDDMGKDGMGGFDRADDDGGRLLNLSARGLRQPAPKRPI